MNIFQNLTIFILGHKETPRSSLGAPREVLHSAWLAPPLPIQHTQQNSLFTPTNLKTRANMLLSKWLLFYE